MLLLVPLRINPKRTTKVEANYTCKYKRLMIQLLCNLKEERQPHEILK